MYAIITTFTADLAEIDAARADHGSWLDEQQRDGVLVIAGRQDPRRGGVVLIADIPRAELNRRLAEEPFARSGLASHEVVCFVASRAADGLEQFLER